MSASPFKVLWVYQQVKDKRGFSMEAGQKPSLCFKGRKYMLCVAAGHPVRVIKRDAKDFDKLREVWRNNQSYDVAAAAAQFRSMVDRHGITKGAEAILTRVESNAESVGELDEEVFENEEELKMTDETSATDASGTTTPTTKETKMKKTTKTKKPAKVAGKKASTKATTKKATVAKSDGLGREGTVTRAICEALANGKTNEQTLAAARSKFPGKKIPDNYASWYRNSLTKKGLLKMKKG